MASQSSIAAFEIPELPHPTFKFIAGAKNGVVTKIQQIEPKAAFMRCFGNALNLSANDTIKRSTSMKDCLDTCFELIKLIKFSPKQETLLNKIKEDIGSKSPSICTKCPTNGQ